MAHFVTSCVFLSRTAIGPPPNVTLATAASRCLVRLECTATFHVYTHISDRREVFAFQTNTREGAGCDPTWATTRRSWPRRSALSSCWDGVDSFPKRIDLTIIRLSPKAIWLILPVVIRLSQRLSHACLSINDSIL